MIRSIMPGEEIRQMSESSTPVLVAFLRSSKRYSDQFEILDKIQKRLGSRIRCMFYSDSFLDEAMRSHLVQGTPSYLLFKDGWEVGRLIGRSDDISMTEFINRCLGN